MFKIYFSNHNYKSYHNIKNYRTCFLRTTLRRERKSPPKQNGDPSPCKRLSSFHIWRESSSKSHKMNTRIQGCQNRVLTRKIVRFYESKHALRLNRTTKSKMSKIGLKSSKIAKIGWNRAKSRSQDRLYDFNIIVALKVPPMSTCQTPIGFSFSYSRDSSVFGLRLFANSHPIHLLCIC